MGYLDSYDFEGEYVTWTTDGANAGTVFYRNGRFNCTNVCGTIKVNGNDARFVSLVLSRTAPRHVSRQLGNPKLMNDVMKQVEIPLPRSIDEQRAIAAVLRDMDSLLEGLDRLIAKKRDIKQSAMQRLLAGRVRLPGFDDEWRQTRLGDHLTFLNNGTNSRAELAPEGRVKNLHYGDIHASPASFLLPSMLPSLPIAKAKRLQRLRDGDLVFADASEDIAGICKSVELRDVGQVEVVAGLHTIAVRFDKAVLADGFKGFLQYCPPFAKHLRRLAAGTKVYATSKAHIASVEMRLPSIAEQFAIAAALSDMDAELTALQFRRNKTRGLKQAMMQELLTGRTRLPLTEASV